MPDDETQQPDNAPPSTPPPPQSPPPPGPPPPHHPPAGGSDDRQLMIILAYLWIICLVPLLAKKDDAEVQWHAKHGLVILIAEFILWVVASVLSTVGIGCLMMPLLFVASVAVRIIAIVKGTKGERLIIPGLSDFASKF